jgi:DNA modification methylase
MINSIKLPQSVEDIARARSLDTAIPIIAKSPSMIADINQTIRRIPTSHQVVQGDSRNIDFLDPNAIHLVLTSPPYWKLKRYNALSGQMGHIEDYEEFLSNLDKVWKKLFNALVPGGRLICVVGDVCLSRRKNNGEHTCVPLHSSIQDRCRKIGYSNLAPIIWYKIANASYEVEGNTRFLGKPYEPNGVIKNDIEYILMLRKPGGYRKPTREARLLSVISDPDHKKWFKQIWNDISGASTKNHPAPYPIQLADRLIRMFSFVGDTVVDPFMGTGTTNLAAALVGRNSIGIEIDPHYFIMSKKRLLSEANGLFGTMTIESHILEISNHGHPMGSP